jgi:hypothetical protein
MDLEEVLAAAEAEGLLLNNLFVAEGGQWRAEFRRAAVRGGLGFAYGATPRAAVLAAFALAQEAAKADLSPAQKSLLAQPLIVSSAGAAGVAVPAEPTLDDLLS